MTIVVARRFGERICVLADTMISDPNQPRPNIIPGQLKAIVISLTISIAYAGSVVLGIKAARDCRSAVLKGAGLAEIIGILRGHSEDGHCEFLVASHESGAQIFKIRNGAQTAAQDQHWIGDSAALARHDEISRIVDDAMANTLRGNPSLTDVRTDESRFISAFTQLFLTSPQVTTCVGGLAVTLLGSPSGHCYQQHAGSYSPGVVMIGGPPRPSPPPCGGETYSYNFLESNHRGVAIAGAFLEQARVGYIYNPLVSDEPALRRDTTMRAVIDELVALAESNGGKPEHEC